ncbi:MAG TPA: hypothetical protein VFV95_13475 [Vicinamibacterales bacterium]|nr:hypothetical protein [Vicinamibacterales bacterium]
MTRNHRLFPLSPARTSLALGACVFAAACMGAPLTNTPINTGTDSTTAARKALEGTWRLVSLEVANADGKKTTVQAEGELVLDAFANLKIIYRVAEAGLKALESVGVEQPTPVISTTGEVAIDVAGQKVTYVGADHSERAFDPDLAARRANPFALERVRYYSVGADGILTLKTRHDNGKDAATSRWQRAG